MKHRIMSHLVAGYPDYDSSWLTGKALIDGGTSYLEIQFPFSDGTADGPLIQSACHLSLDAGFTIAQGFKLVGELRQYAMLPIFIMTYANIAFVNGIESFLEKSKAAGANGMIIPDLPTDSDENLYAAGRALGLHIVPVVAPSINAKRLSLIFAKQPEYIYASLRKGITGEKTEIGAENLEFISRIAAGGSKILGGFGISGPEQVALLSGYLHAAVVGSEFLRLSGQAGNNKDKMYELIFNKIKMLADA